MIINMDSQTKDVQEKKWGLYPAFLVPEQVEQFDEIGLWNRINKLGGAIFYAFHDDGKPWSEPLSAAQLIDAQYALEYLVYETRRFGVEFSRDPSADRHMERSLSYDAWFRFWNNHFESMDPDVYNAFVSDRNAGRDVSKYMPADTWKDHFVKPEGYAMVKKIGN